MSRGKGTKFLAETFGQGEPAKWLARQCSDDKRLAKTALRVLTHARYRINVCFDNMPPEHAPYFARLFLKELKEKWFTSERLAPISRNLYYLVKGIYILDA